MNENSITLDYEPLPGQATFHRDASRIKLFSGGVASGKTVAGSYEALALACCDNAGFDGMIVAPTWSILQRVTLRQFLKVLPSRLISSISKSERRIELINGSTIFFASADREYTLEGVNLSWFWVDEARFISRDAFNILLARLRAPGAPKLQGVLTSTPSMGWLFSEFGERKKHRGVTVASSRENVHLAPEFIEDLKSSYSDTLFASYVDGRFVHLTGGVFPQFDLDLHVSDLRHDPRSPVCVGLDFGYRKPSAVFFQVFEHCQDHHVDDCIHVLDELHPNNTSTQALAVLMGQFFNRNNWKRGVVYCDPAGSAKSVTVGWSDIDVLEAGGWKCEYSYNPVDRHVPYGIERCRVKLKDAGGRTSLYFSRRCLEQPRGIIRALQLSEYPSEGRDLSDVPTKDGEYDHARDALRYAIVNLSPEARSFFA